MWNKDDHEHVWMTAEVVTVPVGFENQIGDTVRICAMCFTQEESQV